MKSTADPVYLFLHLPKSAGTTFRHHIENNFEQDRIVALYNTDDVRMKRDDVFAKVAALTEDQKRRVHVVYGHELYWGLHELFDRPCRYVTFLRDPVEKTISFYNYRMQQGIRSGKLDAAKLPPFDEWLANSPGMHDGMLGDLEKYGFAEGHDVSEAALDSLMRKFYFVGTTESFDEDALFLYAEMGVRRFFRDQNKSERFLAPDELERVRSRIAEKTPLDRRVYEFAVAWNRAYKQRHPEFADVVRKMKLKRTVAKGVQRFLPG